MPSHERRKRKKKRSDIIYIPVSSSALLASFSRAFIFLCTSLFLLRGSATILYDFVLTLQFCSSLRRYPRRQEEKVAKDPSCPWGPLAVVLVKTAIICYLCVPFRFVSRRSGQILCTGLNRDVAHPAVFWTRQSIAIEGHRLQLLFTSTFDKSLR